MELDKDAQAVTRTPACPLHSAPWCTPTNQLMFPLCGATRLSSRPRPVIGPCRPCTRTLALHTSWTWQLMKRKRSSLMRSKPGLINDATFLEFFIHNGAIRSMLLLIPQFRRTKQPVAGAALSRGPASGGDRRHGHQVSDRQHLGKASMRLRTGTRGLCHASTR